MTYQDFSNYSVLSTLVRMQSFNVIGVIYSSSTYINYLKFSQIFLEIMFMFCKYMWVNHDFSMLFHHKRWEHTHTLKLNCWSIWDKSYNPQVWGNRLIWRRTTTSHSLFFCIHAPVGFGTFGSNKFTVTCFSLMTKCELGDTKLRNCG